MPMYPTIKKRGDKIGGPAVQRGTLCCLVLSHGERETRVFTVGGSGTKQFPV